MADPNNSRTSVNQPSIVVKGRVISGADLREYAERNGLCTKCGVYRTHKKAGNFLKPRLEPMTVTNAQNVITVYKGYCIAPTCYTLEKAKQLLGEIPFRRQSQQSMYPSMQSSAEQLQVQNNASWGTPDRDASGRQHYPSAAAMFASPTTQSSKRYSQRQSDESLSTAQSQVRRLDLNNNMQGEGSAHSLPFPVNDEAGHSHVGPAHRVSTGDRSYRTRHGTAPSAEMNSYASYARGAIGSKSAPNLDFHDSLSSFGENEGKNGTFYERNIIGGSNLNSEHAPTDSMQRSVWNASNTFSPPPRLVGSDRTPSTITECTEPSTDEDPIVKALEEKIEDKNLVEFFNLLDDKQREPHVILEGFRLLRYHVVREHMLKPEGVVLAGENWVKVINGKIDPSISQQANHREVVVSGLATLLTISRQSVTYKRSMVRKNATEVIMKLVEEYYNDADVVEVACSVIISLSLHEKHSLNAKSFPRIATLVRKLAYVVLTDDYLGKGFALRAIFHISNQRKKSETTNKTALHDVRNAIGNEPTIRAVLETIQPDYLSPPLVEAGLALLWKVCLPKEEDMSRVLGSTVNNINLVVMILEQATTPEALEASCGLVANLALQAGFPAELAHRAAARICGLLVKPDIRTEEVANVAVHAFCNLLANASAKAGIMAVNSVVRSTVLLLKENPAEEEVVEYSCLSLSHAALDQPNIKRYISGPECFPYVQKAFQMFVASRMSDPSLPIKDATLCAFASISGCDVGVKALVESGLAESLQTMHSMETDADFQRILEVIMRNIAAHMEGGGLDQGSILRKQPAVFQQLLRNAVSEEDVLSLVQELRESGESGLPALGNHGFDELLAVMARYEYSSPIQQEVCCLLAEIFFRIPLADVESPIQLPGGSWAVLHRKSALDLLCNAMNSHPEDHKTQIFSIMALINLLSPLCNIDVESPNVLQVQNWLAPVWRHIMKTMTSYPKESNVQGVGLQLCWVLATISSEEDLKISALPLLQHIFDTMLRLPTPLDLKLAACDILVQLQTNLDCIDYMGNANCVEQMVNFLDGDSAELATSAAALLSTLATQVFVAIGQLMQIPNIVRRLIACMNSYQSEHYIAIHVSIILETLINFEDVSLRYTILENGGVTALCNLMDIHPSNPVLCRHACRVLTLIVPYMDPNALGSLRMPLESTFLPLLQNQGDNPETEAALLDLLWAVGSLDDYFRSVLLTKQNLQVIIQSMSVHLGSDDLQRSGCGMLWLLSGYGDGKRLVGDNGGIPAILNAMMAHSQSTSIQKEGLTALKNLATELSNKPILADYDCVRVVTYSLWINYQHPLVISSALSALNNIAIDSRTKSVAPLPPEVLEIVLSAMRRFSNDEILQKNACFYLKSCTYLCDNRVLMGQHTEELFSVLLQASENFPQTCRERAQSIMKKVQN